MNWKKTTLTLIYIAWLWHDAADCVLLSEIYNGSLCGMYLLINVHMTLKRVQTITFL